MFDIERVYQVLAEIIANRENVKIEIEVKKKCKNER